MKHFTVWYCQWNTWIITLPHDIWIVVAKNCEFAGGIIALGVFGGFVFLAAIITTIVILIRRWVRLTHITWSNITLQGSPSAFISPKTSHDLVGHPVCTKWHINTAMYDTCYYNSVIIWYGDTLVIILTSFYSYFTTFLSNLLLTHSCLAHSHSTSVNLHFTSWSELTDMVSAFEIYRQKDNHKSEQEPRQRRCKHKDRPKTPTSGNTEQNWTQSPLTTNHLTSPQHILMHPREKQQLQNL